LRRDPGRVATRAWVCVVGQVQARETKLSEIAVKQLAVEICAALEVVHQTGLLHRDIKPDNVFITKENRVVLIDFSSGHLPMTLLSTCKKLPK
jgi:serine/threonine protein kinase